MISGQAVCKQLKAKFGKAITKIVLEVTEDKNLPKAERKRLQIEYARHASKPAKLVKLADKICNLQDILYSPPAKWPLKRKQEYFDLSEEVIDQVQGTNQKLEKILNELYTFKP